MNVCLLLTMISSEPQKYFLLKTAQKTWKRQATIMSGRKVKAAMTRILISGWRERLVLTRDEKKKAEFEAKMKMQ